jgi:hypothetical protein
MSHTPQHDKLDAFMDRLLGPAEEAKVRRAVDADPELQRETELQRWIDSELGEMFAYDSSRAPVIPHVEEAAPQPIPFRRPNLFKPLALAAAVVLAGIAVWIGVNRSGSKSAQLYVAADTVYNKLVSRGFEPEFVCTTDEEFRAATKKRFGTPLMLASTPGVIPLGWAYNAGFRGRIVGDKTMMLLAKVDDKNVLVLMDTSDRPADRPITGAPGLKVFKRSVGPIVNYEITPLDRERVINNLREP